MTPIDDDTLSKTLARLASFEIPDGLEQRLLARLAAHTASPPPRGAHHLSAQVQHQLASLWRRRPLLAAAALAALVIVAGGLRHLAPHPSTRTIDLSLRFIARSPVPLVPSPEAQRAPLLPTPAQPAHRQTHRLAPTAASTPQQAVTDTDRALAETNAPSQLAPPFPLTEDERTLLVLAKRSTPDALRTLDATHRAIQEADDKAAFDAFFTPPHTEPSGESE